MRAPLLVASLVALSPLMLLVLRADPADPAIPGIMGQAQRAYVAGDYDTARELFSEVVALDPHNTLAIQFLRNIRLRQAGIVTPTHDPIKELVLQKVDFKNASFSSALDFLKQKAAEQSVTISFVSQLPPPQMDRAVTLSLSQIPFLDALNYLCQLNHATYKVEKYAIVISPVLADAAASPAAQ